MVYYLGREISVHKRHLSHCQMASRRKKYNQEDMDRALQALEETDENTLNNTAKEYGIPQSTLHDRVTGKSKERMGRPSILSPEEEGALVVYAKYLAEKGFPPTVRVIKALAFEVEKKRAKGRGEEPRFKDSGPGKRWWKGFKGRHPDLSLRSPDQLDKERAAFSTAGVVFEHFERLEQILTDAKAKDKRPHVIYNADETGMDLSAKVSKVIVPKGWKRSPSRRVGGRDHVSALVCISAAGQTVPPMIIYNKAFPGGKYTEGGPAKSVDSNSHPTGTA
ncbi:uncharacterized protein LOC118406522 [Branchiostoma floridae]|uniref:Uncharacterized protein LOC118406522 n=1 Tax=Branchiostoma floridae TaxID=7739 RepID=A0A9J7HS93_BRAFL|nr:uncharacterized protein LOC118406522 [Branchiostoma floridae]